MIIRIRATNQQSRVSEWDLHPLPSSTSSTLLRYATAIDRWHAVDRGIDYWIIQTAEWSKQKDHERLPISCASQDGSFPATEQVARLFDVSFESIKQELKDKGLESSGNTGRKDLHVTLFVAIWSLVADEVHRLISTASILFYFLHHSQKVSLPVDFNTIQQLVSKARAELDAVSSVDCSCLCIVSFLSCPWVKIQRWKLTSAKGKLQWTSWLRSERNTRRSVRTSIYRRRPGNPTFNIEWVWRRNKLRGNKQHTYTQTLLFQTDSREMSSDTCFLETILRAGVMEDRASGDLSIARPNEEKNKY